MKYVSEDGKEFATELECAEYEKNSVCVWVVTERYMGGVLSTSLFLSKREAEEYKEDQKDSWSYLVDPRSILKAPYKKQPLKEEAVDPQDRETKFGKLKQWLGL